MGVHPTSSRSRVTSAVRRAGSLGAGVGPEAHEVGPPGRVRDRFD